METVLSYKIRKWPVVSVLILLSTEAIRLLLYCRCALFFSDISLGRWSLSMWVLNIIISTLYSLCCHILWKLCYFVEYFTILGRASLRVQITVVDTSWMKNGEKFRSIFPTEFITKLLSSRENISKSSDRIYLFYWLSRRQLLNVIL